MQIHTFKSLVLSLFLSISLVGNATKSDSGEGGEFNTNELIFHHITDSHEFHVAGDVTIPLPVILISEGELVTFMSSEFNHDDTGTHIVEKNGQRFVNVHQEIYALNEGASSVEMDAAGHPVNASKPYDFSITKNVFSMFLSVLLMLALFLTAARSYKKSENNVPTGIGKFLEPIIVFIRDEVAIPKNN